LHFATFLFVASVIAQVGCASCAGAKGRSGTLAMYAFLNVASSCGPLSTERCPFSCLIGAVLKVLRCIVFRTGSSFGCCGVDRCMCVSMCAWGPLPRAMQSKKLKKRTGKDLENATGQPKQMRYWSRGCTRDSIVVKQAVQASPNRMHQRIRGKGPTRI
jgi:hypothetical protein